MDVFSVVGPIMIGPSSSHTAGACKIGNIAAILLGGKVKKADITLFGSFARTGRGHGTDKALVAGLMGYRSDDVRLKDALTIAKVKKLDIHFGRRNKAGAHPNTVEIHATAESGESVLINASSIGGGQIIINQINEYETHFGGDHHTMIIVHRDALGMVAKITEILAVNDINIARMKLHRSKKGGQAALIIESDHKISDAVTDSVTELENVDKLFVIPKV